MSTLSCEIVHDLLPAYTQGSCSKSTKALVEEHMLECKTCSEYLSIDKGVEMISDRADNMKLCSSNNIQRSIAKRKLVGLGCLIGLIAIIIVFIKVSCGAVPLQLYYLISPVCVVTSYYMLLDHTITARNSKWKTRMSILGLILVCYSIFLMFSTIRCVENNSYPFGLRGSNLESYLILVLLELVWLLYL
jgi:hypothetical protein